MILYARRRKIRVIDSQSNVALSEPPVRRIVVSGSRGIAGIVNKNTVLTLLDIEESEGSEDSDEDIVAGGDME